MLILVLNAGSTSLKLKLYDMSESSVVADCNCQKVGGENADVKYKSEKTGKITKTLPILSHADALVLMLEMLTSGDTKVIGGKEDIKLVAHRASMGGDLKSSVLIDESIIKMIEAKSPLAPLHNPVQIRVIRDTRRVFGEDFPMAVSFDTAFNATIPPVAYLYAVPYRLYEEHDFRRYGYHGQSYQFVAERYETVSGNKLEGMNIVACHLGGGSSVCAIKDGKAIDNSFGIGTGQGPACSTRAGTVDHTGIGYIMQKENLTYQEIEDMLHRESGLLGISGVSGDEKEIEDAAFKGHERAQLTLDIMAYQIKTYIGSYAFAMGGLDAIIFTGGIGENSDYMREHILKGLEAFGIKLDKDANRDFNRQEHKISAKDSKVEIWIIPTNEELVIARDAVKIYNEWKK